MIPFEVRGGSCRVITHADITNSALVRSVAGVGPISITGKLIQIMVKLLIYRLVLI